MSYEEFQQIQEQSESQGEAASQAYTRQIELKATIYGACAALVVFFASTVNVWLAESHFLQSSFLSPNRWSFPSLLSRLLPPFTSDFISNRASQ